MMPHHYHQNTCRALTHAERPVSSVAFLTNTGSLSWRHFSTHSVYGAATMIDSARIYFCDHKQEKLDQLRASRKDELCQNEHPS